MADVIAGPPELAVFLREAHAAKGLVDYAVFRAGEWEWLAVASLIAHPMTGDPLIDRVRKGVFDASCEAAGARLWQAASDDWQGGQGEATGYEVRGLLDASGVVDPQIVSEIWTPSPDYWPRPGEGTSPNLPEVPGLPDPRPEPEPGSGPELPDYGIPDVEIPGTGPEWPEMGPGWPPDVPADLPRGELPEELPDEPQGQQEPRKAGSWWPWILGGVIVGGVFVLAFSRKSGGSDG